MPRTARQSLSNSPACHFLFDPLVRYACRQMSLERELACDDRVVSLGANAATYAESILKVAERSVAAGLAFNGRHQLALISLKTNAQKED